MTDFGDGDWEDEEGVEVKLTDTEGTARDDGAPLSPTEQAFQFVKLGDFDSASKIVETSPGLWKEEHDGHTLLHWAALSGNDDFVAKGLAAAAEVDAKAANGQTPLMWAVLRGHICLARMLVKAGASVYFRDSLGATSLILAIQHQQHKAILLLMALGDPEKLFAQVDENGCGAVHWAAYKGDIMTLKILAYFKVDMTVLDNSRMSVLHRAAQSSQNETMQYLIELDIDPSLRDSQGRTVLDMVEEQRDEVTKRLLHRLLNVSKSDVGSVVIGNQEVSEHDSETGAMQLKRKVPNKEKQMLDDIRKKIFGNAAALFWLMAVSICTFQYISDIRLVCWNVAPTMTLLFELGMPASLGLFAFTVFSDPGKVPPRVQGNSGVEELMRVFSAGSASEIAEVDLSRLCFTTWVLKGLRTKYCKATGACVEEFDHFCGWLNVAIGKGNHRPFIILAITEVATQFVYLYLCWAAVASGQLVNTDGIWALLTGTAGQYPLLTMVFMLHLCTAPGILCLVVYQFNLINKNLLTNEMMNAHRYKHFWPETQNSGNEVDGFMRRKSFTNIFDKGSIVKNWIDFWWTRRRSERGSGAPPKTVHG